MPVARSNLHATLGACNVNKIRKYQRMWLKKSELSNEPVQNLEKNPFQEGLEPMSGPYLRATNSRPQDTGHER